MFSQLRHRWNLYQEGKPAARRRYELLRRHIDTRDGFFVEAGANDGIRQSNTLGFELWAGWSGLLVEPIPELADQCRKNRPHCTVENVALVADDQLGAIVTMHAAGLMSLVKGSLQDDGDESRHLEIATRHNGTAAYQVDVPAVTLAKLLGDHEIDTVDFLSLDVEGFELQVLKGLNLEKHRPKMLLIETGNRPDIVALLSPYYEALDSYQNDDTLWKLKVW